MSIRIRDATPADIPRLAELVAASYRDSFLPIIGEAGLALRRPAFFIERFAAEWPHVRVACDEADDLLAMAEVRDGTLDMLFLKPGSTGNGIGQLLLADAEARGAGQLECFAMNAGARRFYARAGWTETRAYTRDFAGATHDFVAMTKPTR
jgi:putative acetyltransferase